MEPILELVCMKMMTYFAKFHLLAGVILRTDVIDLDTGVTALGQEENGFKLLPYDSS